MPSYTISDAIKFTGMPTKTIGKPIKTRGEAVRVIRYAYQNHRRCYQILLFFDETR